MTPRLLAVLCAASAGATALAASAPLLATQPAPLAPRSGVWITYHAFGSNSFTGGTRTNSLLVSVGDMRWPNFSIRLARYATTGAATAELSTPAGYDDYRLRFSEIPVEDPSTDPLSRASEREVELRKALTHHRPVVRLTVAANGRVSTARTPELIRHEACARGLVRGAIVEQIRAAENESQRRRWQEWLENDHIVRRLSPPVETAALLLQLTLLPLPDDDAALVAFRELEDRLREDRRGRTQWDWRSEQVHDHGRSVGRVVDLRVARNSRQARLCRTLPYTTLLDTRSDSCRVEAIFDRRDGWPITMSIVREGVASDGAEEMQFRRFDRIAPLEGFIAPPNPCG